MCCVPPVCIVVLRGVVAAPTSKALPVALHCMGQRGSMVGCVQLVIACLLHVVRSAMLLSLTLWEWWLRQHPKCCLQRRIAWPSVERGSAEVAYEPPQ